MRGTPVAGGFRSAVPSSFVEPLSGSVGEVEGVPEGLFVPSVSGGGEGDGLVGAVEGRWAAEVVRDDVGSPPPALPSADRQ
ncbi:hypothetical protein, partial [Streptomyces caniscabiei]|uniref:hypothetical protein n=1 Tax=Streptomyces caniscabiei TaxID=2746961 RepID=UPI0030B9861C